MKVFFKVINSPILSGALAFLIPFMFSFQDPADTDAWFHLKFGEYVFTTHHLLHNDVFSFSAVNRVMYQTEWLYQTILYGFVHFLGMRPGIAFYTGLVTGTEILILFVLIRYILKSNVWITLFVCLFYFAQTSYAATERPFELANIFLLVWIGIIYTIIHKRKYKLFLLLPPIMYLWSNLHETFPVGLGLIFAYAVMYWISGTLQKRIEEKKLGLGLFIVALTCTAVTLLPPVSFGHYIVLFSFIKYAANTYYISEYAPISLVAMCIYIPTITITTFFAYLFVNKSRNYLLFFLPLAALLLLPFLSERHIILATIPLVFFVCMTYMYFQSTPLPTKKKQLITVVLLVLLSAEGIFYYDTYQPGAINNVNDAYPVAATTFLLKNHLQGNMLNGYGYGAYLLYRLYPQIKVWVDSSFEPYICCEVGYLNKILNAPTAQEATSVLSQIITNYNISFVIVTRSDPGMNSLIREQKKFYLVYWDDYAQIYVKDDGKNTPLLQKYKAVVTFPLADQPYDTNQPQKALAEEGRMITVTDSAYARAITGLIYTQIGNFPLAERSFEKAIQINPSLYLSYLKLADVYFHENRYNDAINVLLTVIHRYPTYGRAYLLLGDLYAAVDGNDTRATTVWQNGLNKATNTTDKNDLEQALNAN